MARWFLTLALVLGHPPAPPVLILDGPVMENERQGCDAVGICPCGWWMYIEIKLNDGTLLRHCHGNEFRYDPNGGDPWLVCCFSD